MSDQSTTTEELRLGDPYCGACGYRLSGCTDSAKCPECGRPLVEVLSRAGRFGRRYETPEKLFGLPILSVALGGWAGERTGHARGIIAIGDRATGLIAIGGRARGVVAIGGLAMGLFSFGGMSLGLVSAWGGLAAGALANGGMALGYHAYGGMAAGWIAVGGMALGQFAAGGAAIGPYTAGAGGNAPEAIAAIRGASWYFGPPQSGLRMMIQPLVVSLGLTLAAALGIGAMALFGLWRGRRRGEPDAAR